MRIIDKEIADLKYDLSLKTMKIKKLDEKIVACMLQNESEKRMQGTLQETIADLKKLNDETADMYKAKINQKER